MFLWFLGTALVSVYFVFTDPRFDYRLLLVGSLVPDLIDVPFGQARWAHSLTVAVGVLASVRGRGGLVLHRRFGLDDAARRNRFLREGVLSDT